MKTKILTTSILFIFSLIINGQIIHVPNDQPTIQDGINAAGNGDTVLVAEDTYFENINFKGKAITVASNFILDMDTTHINNTIIDGSQPIHPDSASVVYFISGENTNSIIQGFTITNGKGTYLPTTRRGGGGILCYYSGAKILNNNIERDTIINEEEGINILGGGLYYFADNEWEDTLIIMHNHFRWNYLKNTAAGKQALGSTLSIACPAIITENKIMNNVAEANKVRASLYCISPPNQAQILISNNTISHNTSVGTGDNSRAYGSGIYIRGYNGGISNNLIEYNQTENGEISHGAILIYNTDSTFVIENNIIKNNGYLNSIACWGGAISLRFGTAKVVNNLIFYNKAINGGGICNYDTLASRTQIINNTIVHNLAEFGGGVLNIMDNPVVLNSIIYNNSADNGSEIYDEGGLVIVNYSNIKGSWEGIENIDIDPQFVDPENGDFHIYEDSPCAGTGIDSIEVDGIMFYCPSFDFEGDIRPTPYTAMPDMGADEVDESTEIQKNEILSSKFQLSIFPNPFIDQTTIEFSIQHSGFVRLSIIDFTGKEIQTLISEKLPYGKYRKEWKAESSAGGNYFLKLETNGTTETKKLLIIN